MRNRYTEGMIVTPDEDRHALEGVKPLAPGGLQMGSATVPQERIAVLEKQLADLYARLPKHSTSPAMIWQMEELEEELGRMRQEVASHAAGGR
jgi:hypothetical protein